MADDMTTLSLDKLVELNLALGDEIDAIRARRRLVADAIRVAVHNRNLGAPAAAAIASGALPTLGLTAGA